MELFSNWGYLAQSFSWRAPGILLSLTGFAFAVIWRARYPKTWMKVSVAMTLQLFSILIGVVYFWLISTVDFDTSWYRGWRLGLFNLFNASLDAVALGILIWAAFSDRPKYA